MIKKTIIAAVLLFALYNVFLAFAHPLAGTGQQQWQKNRILIEDYVDYHQDDSVVIVGTSLSARLYPSLLPKGFYNLALAGESIYDGMEVIKHCAKKPKYILIESNLFYKNVDPDLSSGIFSPTMMHLRKWLPSFREENQPANLLGPLFSHAGSTKNGYETKVDTGILNSQLRQKLADYQKLPADTQMAKRLKYLKDCILGFEAEGIKVVLYEIPMHCKLYGTPRYKIPEAEILKALPDTKFHWMPMADCAGYTYTDGEHMDYQSAGKFVDWFVKNLRVSGM